MKNIIILFCLLIVSSLGFAETANQSTGSYSINDPNNNSNNSNNSNNTTAYSTDGSTRAYHNSNNSNDNTTGSYSIDDVK